MTTRSVEQNKRFYKLLSLCSYDDEKKREVVARCTGGRTVHSSEMHIEEMDMAIRMLKAARRDAMRKYMPAIFVCCRALGWTAREDGQEFIDPAAINGYLVKYYNKKALGALSAHELYNLIISLKQIAKHKGIKL